MRMGHIVICGLRASIMFPHYLIKGKIFGKKSEIIGHKTCVLISSKNLFETFLTLRRTERDMVKCLAVFMKSARHSCPIWMKLEASRQFYFEKYSNMNLHENLSSGRLVVPWGRTDRHDEAKSRFSQFCERAYKRVKCAASTKILKTLPHRVSYCSHFSQAH